MESRLLKIGMELFDDPSFLGEMERGLNSRAKSQQGGEQELVPVLRSCLKVLAVGDGGVAAQEVM